MALQLAPRLNQSLPKGNMTLALIADPADPLVASGPAQWATGEEPKLSGVSVPPSLLERPGDASKAQFA
jgi:hypothetical protein